jgi:hypothetical protein
MPPNKNAARKGPRDGSEKGRHALAGGDESSTVSTNHGLEGLEGTASAAGAVAAVGGGLHVCHTCSMCPSLCVTFVSHLQLLSLTSKVLRLCHTCGPYPSPSVTFVSHRR